jgi:hypothetical protein
MNVSLLTKYSNSYPARGAAKANRVHNMHTTPIHHNTEINSDIPGMHKGLFVNHSPSNISKRVGYTELNGLWDQFTVSRFVDLVKRNTGNTLDAGAIMRKYDADGDGLLDMNEQTALIEGLTKAEYSGLEISRSTAESIVEQLRELLSGMDEARHTSGLQRAARMYERLFLYDNTELPEEDAVIAV